MAKVLIVDDQAEARRPLVRLLRQEGYEPLTASDAYEAMGAVKMYRPDLILLDVMIPPMDGLTFLLLLRDNPHDKDIPVILVTGKSDDHTIARAKELGVKGHLIKTQFTTEELLVLIRENIPKSEQNDAQSPSTSETT